MVFLLFLKSFPWYGAATAVLIRLDCSILSPKFPQDLIFTGRMSNSVDSTGFQFALLVIYISFMALASAPICRGASI